MEAVLDSGSGRTIIGSKFVDVDFMTPSDEVVRAVGNSALPALGRVCLPVNMHGIELQLDCLVLDSSKCPVELIIGRDAMQQHGLCLDMNRNAVSGSRKDRSRWTLYLPLGKKESCVLFMTDVPCVAVRETRVTRRDTAVLGCSAVLPAACNSCEVNSRPLVFTGRGEASSDLECVSGIFDPTNPHVLVSNRGMASESVRKGSILGYLDSAADSALDVEESVPVYSSTASTDGIEPDGSCPSASDIPGLSEDQRASVQEIFERHSTVFMRSDADALQSLMTPHRIELTDDTPIYIRPRKMSAPVADEVERQCLDLERLGIIERCESSWNAPIVPIRKKDGTLRLCIDYRRLNQKTVTTRFPMPEVNDTVFGTHHGVQWFSALDISKAYYHLPLEEESRDYTAFSTPRAHWRFRRLPFGLKNAPAQFQKEMQTILHGFAREKLVVYLDDILLKETTFEKHVQLVDDVLTALESQGIKLNGRKCTWFQPEVKFLGHIISSSGLRKSPEYVDQIQRLDKPRTVHQLRQFLGIVNYQRKFVKDCSTIAKPLSALTGLPAKTVLTWTDEMIESFEQLKSDMQADVTLAFPDYRPDASPLCLWVDASAIGAGACLTQEQDGQPRFIAFASMTFTSAQKNYSVTGRELAALRWGVKTFHSFLCAVHFKIYTDHQALMYLHNMRLVNHRLARTVEELADYNYEIIYVPGQSNFAADLLSRMQVSSATAAGTYQNEELPDGLRLRYRPEGGGNSLVDCLRHWMTERDGFPADGGDIRRKLVDEALRSPAKYGFRLDRLSRQSLRLMRFSGQPLAMDMLTVAAAMYKVKIVVHFGPTNPMTFTDDCRSANDILHLQCLGGIHFNLLQSFLETDKTQLTAASVASCRVSARSVEETPVTASQVDDTTSSNSSCKKLKSSCDHDQHTQCTVTAFCNGVPLCGLLDTGAAIGMISASALRLISSHDPGIVIQRVSIPIIGLCGQARCERLIHAQVGMSSYAPVAMVLLVDEADSFGHCLLLGADFMRTVGICLDFASLQIRLGGSEVSMFADPDAQRAAAVSYTVDMGVPTTSSIREHQASSDQLKELKTHVKQSTPPGRLPESLKCFKKHMDHLQLRDDLLVFDHPDNGPLPVISRSWLVELVFHAHEDMAHIGRDKLLDLFGQRLFAPGLQLVISDIVRTCQRCQLYKPSPQLHPPPVKKIECQSPFELVAVDVVMFPRSGRGHLGCLVAVDHCSKWAVAVPLRSKSAAAVARAFHHRVLPALLKVPQRVLSDNGPEFRGMEFESVLSDWKIQHAYSTPYHPEGNGAVERCNRTIGQSLRLLTDSAGDWDLHLAKAMTTYNNTKHAEIGTSPAALLLDARNADTESRVAPVEEQDVWKAGHPKFKPFRIGDRVKKTVQLPGHRLENKFDARYTGPLTVSEVAESGVTYLVKTDDGVERRAHHSQLRTYYDAPAYLKQLLHRRASKDVITAAGPAVASGSRPDPSQIIRAGVLTPTGVGEAPTGQRLVRAATRPILQHHDRTQPATLRRSCLRDPASSRRSQRVRFEMSEDGASRGPLHSSPFFRRSRRVRARGRRAAALGDGGSDETCPSASPTS